MSSHPRPKQRKLLKFPLPPEPPETQAVIDHYLQLADKLLTPNLEREHPEDKTQPYNPPDTNAQR